MRLKLRSGNPGARIKIAFDYQFLAAGMQFTLEPNYDLKLAGCETISDTSSNTRGTAATPPNTLVVEPLTTAQI